MKYRIVWQRRSWPWPYSVERFIGGDWSYLSACGLSFSVWGARRALARHLKHSDDRIVIHEFTDPASRETKGGC